jgi:uncharacterized iron-regulated membrane protein
MSGPRRWKPAVIRLHRWIALSAGLVLVLNALTGLLLLGGRPLDEAVHPHLFKVVPQPAKLPLEPIVRQLRADFPHQSFILHPARQPDHSLDASVRGDGRWEGHVYIDPYTGERLGRRDRFGFNIDGLFELHSSLLAGDTGRAVLGVAASCMAAMFLSGLYLWWPIRWRQAFSITLDGPRLRALFDLHRVAGATLGLWVLAWVLMGAYLAYRPAQQWVNQLAGATPLQAPKTSPPGAAASAPAPTLDQLVGAGDLALPGGSINSIALPAKPTAPVRLRKKLADDPHPNGLSSIWMNPRTGQVLRVDRWNTLAPGERTTSWLYPLHSGQLGGALSVIVAAVAGLSLLGFGVSGSWLWWLRRNARRPKPAALPARRVAS